MFGDKTFEDFIYLDSYCDILSYGSVSLVDGYHSVGGTFYFHSA